MLARRLRIPTPGTGQVWYSQCCTESETTGNPPQTTTTTKQYCFSYMLSGYPNNQHHGIKPTCSKTGGGNTYWSFKNQCSTSVSAADPVYTTDAGKKPALSTGCPGSWDSGNPYEIGDMVEYNGAVYTCSGAALYCRQKEPDLFGVGESYWKATNSCTGTVSPTTSPVFTSLQAGCPEEYDSSNVYGPGDQIAVTRPDGRPVLYTCKAFPQSEFCNVQVYSPLNLAPACNGEPCWKTAWTYGGGCTGTYTPTGAPAFSGNLLGCPEEYDAGTVYSPGDKVSIIGVGEDVGKIYQCKSWPEGAHCIKEAYKPGPGGAYYNEAPLWKSAWSYIGGCKGTISPTGAPNFLGVLDGCPEEYDAGIAYEEGDKVSVKGAGETRGKIYKCKSWPEGSNCVKEAYAPESAWPWRSDPLWKMAWTYVGGCDGTITPTQAPNFATNDGCPEEYVAGTTYEEGDKVSIKGEGETRGKIYKCKGWPDTGYCELEAFKPGPGGAYYGGVALWKTAWTYVGGCEGTISPTGAPVFQSLAQWDKEGCPEEYVPNNAAYQAGDFVSVSKNSDNTLGVVWQCKNDETWTWCQLEGYAPGTEYAGKAWQKIGHCEGTMSPTAAPTPLTANGDPTKHACQFKYKLPTATANEYVVLQAESWVNGGPIIATVTGGTPLTLYKAGTLVRYGSDARKCNSYPYNGYCHQFSPFEQDSSSFNPILSPKGWSKSSCQDVQSVTDTGDDRTVLSDTFQPTTGGPVFASNGNLLVDTDGKCVNGAMNPEDYFKSSDVKGCQKWQPSLAPSSQPSSPPSSAPSSQPSSSSKPSSQPSSAPSYSSQPSTQQSLAPSYSSQPSTQPSLAPSSSSEPSSQPSSAPSSSSEPSSQPSSAPSSSSKPSSQPSLAPSSSSEPSTQPSSAPSSSSQPSSQPSSAPSSSSQPSTQPSLAPSSSSKPSSQPSLAPSSSSEPSSQPSSAPSSSSQPSTQPSSAPSSSSQPSSQPSSAPSSSSQPSTQPSLAPSSSSKPSSQPSLAPSSSSEPSSQPSSAPSSSSQPSTQPSSAPSSSSQPSSQPSSAPSSSSQPSTQPSLAPSSSSKPSSQPSLAPSSSSEPSSQPSSVWAQLGQDIDGEAADDNAGRSVSLSADGTTVAVGASFNDGNGTDSGHVRVYRLDSDENWTKLGQDIDGEAAGDAAGRSVSLSENGTIVAVGASLNDGNGGNSGHARVYRLASDETSWDQLGQDIDGEAAGDAAGTCVSLSADGTTVAVGAYLNDGINGGNSGHVRVYRLDSDENWTKLGQDIDGEAAGDQVSRHCGVSLSANGTIVAFGASLNDGNGINSGHARVYRLDSDETSWAQLGQDIDGEAAGDNAGRSVSLSADGTTVAVGAHLNDGNGTDSGHVRVYRLDSDENWTKLGQDIDGEAADDNAGISVSLSEDGTTVAVGAHLNDGNGGNSGHARVYRLDSDENWTQLGQDIDGEAAGDNAGRFVSLSADGLTVAVGAYLNDGINGGNSGHVRVYEIKI